MQIFIYFLIQFRSSYCSHEGLIVLPKQYNHNNFDEFILYKLQPRSAWERGCTSCSLFDSSHLGQKSASRVPNDHDSSRVIFRIGLESSR
jgi:hypothetical protein